MCVCRCYICGQPPSAWCVRRTTAAWRWVRVTTLFSAARARSHRKTAPTVRRPSSHTLSLTANRRKLLHHHTTRNVCWIKISPPLSFVAKSQHDFKVPNESLFSISKFCITSSVRWKRLNQYCSLPNIWLFGINRWQWIMDRFCNVDYFSTAVDVYTCL